MQAQQSGSGTGHGVRVEGTSVADRSGGQKGIEERQVISQPVRVGPPLCREARIEVIRYRSGTVNDDIVGIQPTQRTAQTADKGRFRRARNTVPIDSALPHECRNLGFAEVQVDSLPARVHSRIGAPGNNRAHARTADQSERLFQGSLDGAQIRLHSPPAEVGAVIAKIESKPHGRNSTTGSASTSWYSMGASSGNAVRRAKAVGWRRCEVYLATARL